MRGAALSPDNLEFLDFLQSDQCKQIFIENKLKINVESSNIYYDNTDTNKGILDFIFNQQNPVKFWILFLISKIRLLVKYLTISLLATVIKIILIG